MYDMPYSVLEFRIAGNQIVFNTQKKKKQCSLWIVDKNGVKNQKDYTVGIVPKYKWKIIVTDKYSILTHEYPTAQFPGLV